MSLPILNTTTCNIYGNTGTPQCEFNPGLIVGAFAIPYGTVLSYPDPNIKATIQTNLRAARSSRWFMFGKFGLFKDNTDAPKTEDLDGFKKVNFVPPYNWEYRVIANQNNFFSFQQMYGFLESQNFYQWIFFDDQNQLLGTQAVDATGLPAIGGFTFAQIFVMPWMQKTTSVGNQYKIEYNGLSVQSANQGLANSTPLGFDILNSLYSLTDVRTYDVTPSGHAHGTNIIQGTVGSSSLSDIFGSTLSAAGAWVATNITTNTTVTPSAVALVTLANGSTGYQFTTTGQANGDKIQIQLAAPSVLAATPYNITPRQIVNELANAAIVTY